MKVRPLGLDGQSIRELTDDEIADLMGGASGSGELFHYSWHNGPRASIDTGRVATDGQKIMHADNPVVCQAVWDGKQNAVTDAVWLADDTKINCWSLGDGTTYVRAPDLNGATGRGKPFYLRGGPDGLNGTSVGDAIRNFTAKIGRGGTPGSGLLFDTTGISGAVRVLTPATGITTSSGNQAGTGFEFVIDPSLVVPTADENRVKTAYGVMTVRVFTEVSNTGAIDAAQLATQLGVVDAAVQALEAQVGFVIIYPNGGTAASPGNVSLNSRYVMPNPFPGRQVICVAEVQYAGEWFETGWALGGSNGGYGVKASQLGDQVVVQVGRGAIFAASGDGGAPLSIATSHSLPTLCRVKVWK